MEKLELNFNNQLVLLEKYEITPTELFAINLIVLAQEEGEEDYLFKFASLEHIELRDILISLRDKGLILKEYKVPNKGDTFNYEDIPLNKNFLKTFYKASFKMGQELFEIYPQFTIVNNQQYKLRRVSKKYNSLEDAFRTYGKYIRWNPEKHQEVLELVQWGVDNGYNFTTLDDFIVDNDWINLKSCRDESSIIVNTNKLL